MDASGSLGWNPACTVRFDGIRLEANAEYFIPWRSLGSTVSPSAFGPGFPDHEMSGETVSARNASLMPSFSFVKHNPESKNAWHVGMLGVAGFGVDYAENTDFSNPILTAQPPNGMGFGAIDSNYALMKTPIGMSRLITDRFSVGVSAVPALSMLRVTPAPFSAPVMNGSGYPEYMGSEKSSKALGLGASVGANYRARQDVSLGVSYSSAIKFGKFQWQIPDGNGTLHDLEFRMDMPAVTSMGVGYYPTRNTVVAMDARFIDYTGTQGFQGGAFNPDGSVDGFGWNNIWAFGGGVEQKLNETWRIRGGYNYSQNPIPDELAFLNTPAPAIVQHHISAGFTHSLSAKMDMHLVYYHVFRASQSGPFLGAQGAMPGASVTSKLREDSIAIGITRTFGSFW